MNIQSKTPDACLWTQATRYWQSKFSYIEVLFHITDLRAYRLEKDENKMERLELEDAFDLPRLPLQGPPFGRPLSYLVAALIESDKPKYELAEICDAIKELMENVKAFQKQRMCEDREVRHRGREWLKSIGRQARRSLSPRTMRSTPGSVPA